MLLNGMGGLSGLQDTAWHSGLRIHCHTCGVGMGRSDLIHGLGTPFATGQPKKKEGVGEEEEGEEQEISSHISECVSKQINSYYFL